jgi:hypothetical protein
VALIVVGSLIWSSLKFQGQLPTNVAGVIPGDVLVSASASDLESFSDSLVNDRSESDFFFEVAAQKIDTLSHDETASVFDRLME